MKEWQPKVKDVHEMELKLTTDYGFGTVMETHAHISEGDTLFIRQEGFENKPQHVTLGKYEFYDIIFNFMSFEELTKLVIMKNEKDFKKI